jgi:hypothetical protein
LVIRAIDDFLIDRVFQRISDALARWVSCYGIAAFWLAGAILSEFAAAVMPHDVLAALLGIVWVFRLIRVHRMDAAAYSDVLPAERIKDVFWRPAGVALCVLHSELPFFLGSNRSMPSSWLVASVLRQTY